MKIGDYVIARDGSGLRGKVVYSTFGVSVIGRMPDGSRFQSLGEPIAIASEHWRLDEGEEGGF